MPREELDELQPTDGTTSTTSIKVERPRSGAVDDAAETAPDPFEPERYRLSQDFNAQLGVKKVLTRIPVRKPNGTWWFRVHPDPKFRIPVRMLELKEESEIYLVDPTVAPELAGESSCSLRQLTLSVTRQGLLVLWPCRLPDEDGKLPDWMAVPLEACSLAQSKWVRLSWNRSFGCHEIFESDRMTAEPEWPTLSPRDVLELGCKGSLIDSLDHPVVLRLRGEA